VARPAGTGGTPIPSSVDTGAVYAEGFGANLLVGCFGVDPDQCTIVHGAGPHLLLMGDSNAEMMIPAFSRLARENDLTLSLAVTAGCPWQRGIYRNNQAIQATCRQNREDAYNRVIDALDPDVIILMTRGDDDDFGPLDPAKGPPDEALITATKESLDQLATGDRKIVVLEPIPLPPGLANPLTCLATAEWLEECRYIASANPSWQETALRERADTSDTIWSADLDPLVCPYFPICDPIVDGFVVKWDAQHLAARFSRQLAEPLAAYLRSNGVIP